MVPLEAAYFLESEREKMTFAHSVNKHSVKSRAPIHGSRCYGQNAKDKTQLRASQCRGTEARAQRAAV